MDNISKLYADVSKKINIGTENQVRGLLSTKEGADKFYNVMTKEYGVDLGNHTDFMVGLGHENLVEKTPREELPLMDYYGLGLDKFTPPSKPNIDYKAIVDIKGDTPYERDLASMVSGVESQRAYFTDPDEVVRQDMLKWARGAEGRVGAIKDNLEDRIEYNKKNKDTLGGSKVVESERGGYINEAGHRYDTRAEAEIEQNRIDQLKSQSYRLSRMEEQLGEMKDRSGELLKESKKEDEKNFSQALGMGPYYGSMMRHESPNTTAIRKAQADLDEAQETLNELYRQRAEGGETNYIQNSVDFWKNLGSGNIKDAAKNLVDAGKDALTTKDRVDREFLETISKFGNWDFGMTDATFEGTLVSAILKKDNGQPVSKQEQFALDASGLLAGVTEEVGDLGWAHTAGHVTGAAVPFIIETILNPGKGIGTGAQRLLTKYAIKKYGKEVVKNNIKKYLASKAVARVSGDIAGSLVGTATTGFGRTAANAAERQIGSVQTAYDENGNIVYGGHVGGEDALTAWGKAFADRTFENWSEMSGAYFAALGAPIKAVIGKGIGRLIPEKMLQSDFAQWATKRYGDLKKSKFYKGVDAFKKSAQIGGLFEEYLEEKYGDLMRLSIGDTTFDTNSETGIFNLERNVETLVSLIPTQVGFGMLRLGGARTANYQYRQQRKAADKYLDGVLGENWKALRMQLDAAQHDPTAIAQIYSNMNQIGGNIPINVRRAVMNYINAQQSVLHSAPALYQSRTDRVDIQEQDGKFVASDKDAMGNVLGNKTFETREEADAYATNRMEETRDDDMHRFMQTARGLNMVDYNQTAEQFMQERGFDNMTAEEQAEFLDEMSSGRGKTGKAWIEFKTKTIENNMSGANFAISSWEQAHGLEPGTIEDILDRQPTERTIEENDILSEAYGMLHDLAYPQGKAHVEQSKLDGIKLADEANLDAIMDVNEEGASAAKPDNAELAQLKLERETSHNIALNTLRSDTDMLTVFGEVMGNNGADAETVIQTLASMDEETLQNTLVDVMNEGVHTEKFQSVVDAVNAQAKYNAFIQRTGEKIDEKVERESNRRVFKGTLNGAQYTDKPTIITAKDGEHTYQIVNSTEDIVTDENGNVTSQGVFTAIDKNGNVAVFKGSTALRIEAEEELPTFAETMRQGLQEAVSEVIEPTTEEEIAAENAEGGTAEAKPQPAENTGAADAAAMPQPTENTENAVTAAAEPQTASEEVQEEEKPSYTKSKMVYDEKGNEAFDRMPIADTMEELLDGQLEDSQVSELIDNNIEAYAKEVEKLNEKKPKKTTSRAELIAATNKLKADRAEAERKLKYWQDVKAELAKITHTTEEEMNALSEAENPSDTELGIAGGTGAVGGATDTMPVDAVAMASGFLGNNSVKIIPESFRAETGYGTKEQRGFVGMFAGKAKGGKTINEIAEALVEYDNAYYGGNYFKGDSQEARNAVISAFGQARTKADLRANAVSNRDTLLSEWKQKRDDYYYEEFGMSYDDYVAYEGEILKDDIRREAGVDTAAMFADADEAREAAVAEAEPQPAENTTEEEGETEAVPQSTTADAKEPFRARAREWSEKTGVDVALIESIDEVDSDYIREQIIAAEKNNKQVKGWYSQNTGKVFIYMPHAESNEDIETTFIHEVVAHKGLKEMLGDKAFDALCDNVFEMMSPEAQAKFLDYVGAEDINNPTEAEKRAAADEYIAHLAEKTDLTDAEKSVWDNIVKMIRTALETLGLSISITDDVLSNLIKASYAEMVKNSRSEDVSGEDIVAMDESKGTVAFSIKTYEESGRDALKDFVGKQVNDGALTEQDALDIVKELDDIYDVVKKYKDVYAPFGAWSDAAVKVDERGIPVFSVIKQNGEYGMNLDFSLVCKKRRTLDAVFNEMIKRGIVNDISLNGEDVARINDIIRKYGFETACRLCFVDSKRFRVAKVADDFVAMYNELVRMSDNELKKVIKAEKKNTVRKKTARHLLTNPPYRTMEVERGDFISTEGFEKMIGEYPEIMKLYNQAKGSGGPKASFGDVQYLNDVQNTKWTPEKAYEVGGVRLQSFSDYVPRMVFDYIQLIADLAAKNLPVHAYTKEPLFAKQFGLTGIKVNMSLVPRVDADGVAAGLDKDGNYAWQEGETFPYDEAVAIQNAEGYADNCGTIAVGVSDAHIQKMLDDANIRMVIPYHKSGLNKQVAIHNNIDKFTDYTNSQNTRHADGTKVSKAELKDVPNFNADLHKGMNPREAAQKYLDWCDSKGYLPKFDQFRNHPNYYKLLEDFTTIADENGTERVVPQQSVKMQFPTEDSAFGTLESLIVEGLEEDAVLEGQRQEKISDIVDEIESAAMPQSTEEEISDEATPNMGDAISFRVVDDPKVIAELEGSPKKIGYRNVVMNEDDTFSSPMAYWLQHPTGGAKTRVEMDKFKLGEWEEAVEHPEVVDENGKVTLVKPNKKTVGSVAYDPYIHNRLDPVNLQFKEAWNRNDLVYVETEVAEIDLNSGYHADKALYPVGVQSWSNGALMLSRYDKPVRIMPWDEVADAWAKRLDGKGVEFDVVPPALLPLLAERGVEILPPHKGMGKACNEAYEEWKESAVDEGVRFSVKGFTPEEQEIIDEAKKNGTWMKAPNGKATNLKETAGKRTALETMEDHKKQKRLGVYDGTGRIEPAVVVAEDIRFRFVGEQGASNLDKAEEVTTRLDNLNVAREMEEAGKDAKSIKMATGWERGADKKWRYETEDVKMKGLDWVDSKKPLTLVDVVDDEQLFIAYPELRNVKVEKGRQSNGGSFNKEEQRITIHVGSLKKDRKKLADAEEAGYLSDLYDRWVKDDIRIVEETLVHEIQHWIQHKEGFALGGSPRMLKPGVDRTHYDEYMRLANEAAVMYNAMDMAKRKTPVGRQIFDRYERYSRAFKAERKRLELGEEGYKRLSGEVESYNVEKRRGMSLEERRASLATETEDVAREDQIFLYDAVENDKATAGTIFSGGGLIEAGLGDMIDSKFAVEYDANIAGVYRNNHGNHIVVADVRNVNIDELASDANGEIDYFHASPVCKRYSRMTTQEETPLDIETASATASVINKKNPKVVTIENVARYKNSEALSIITDALDANGYTWDANVYDASDYGGATSRRRLIVRAVKDGELPPLPQKATTKNGWYDRVSDLIDTMPSSSLAPYQIERLAKDGINPSEISEPLFVFDGGSPNGKARYAWGSEPLPTILASGSADKIVMPNGDVKLVSPRVLARIMGLPDSYQLPEGRTLAHTILGNGVPVELTEAVIKPMLEPFQDEVYEAESAAMPQRTMFRMTDTKSQYDEKVDELNKGIEEKGLRGYLGEVPYKKMMRTVYEGNDEIAQNASAMLQDKEWNLYDSIETYLADEAQTMGNEEMWQDVRQSLADAIDFFPSIKDTKYAMWLNKNRDNDPSDPNDGIKRNALLYKLEREEREAPVRFRTTPTPVADQAARAQYEKALKRLGYRWSEQWIDGTRSVAELQKAMFGKNFHLADSRDAHEAEKAMTSKIMQKQRQYHKHLVEPLGKAIEACMKDMPGKSRKERYENLKKYMYALHGLERNRYIHVRDIVEDEQQLEDYVQYCIAARSALDYGNIDLPTYFAYLDSYIRQNIDKDFDADKIDKSGLRDEFPTDTEALSYILVTEDRLKKERVNELWRRVRDVNDFALETEYQSGLISGELKAKVASMYGWYIPLRGFEGMTAEEEYDYNNTEVRAVGGPTLMGARGRKSKADDPIATMLSIGSQAIHRAERNEVKKKFYRAAKDYMKTNGQGGLVSELFVWEAKVGTDNQGNDIYEVQFPNVTENMDAQTAAAEIANFEAQMKDLADKGEARQVRQGMNLNKAFEHKKSLEEHIVRVYENGQVHVLYLNGNPRAAQSLNGTLKFNTGWALSKPYRKLQRAMSQMMTSLNLTFALATNPTRDFQSTLMNTVIQDGEKAGLYYIGEYIKNMWNFRPWNAEYVKMFHLYQNNKLDMNKKEHQLFKEFADNGGITGFIESSAIEDYKSMMDGILKTKTLPTIERFADKTVYVLGYGNNLMENMARFATYKAARKRGLSIQNSVKRAKNYSLNFNQRGLANPKDGVAGFFSYVFNLAYLFVNPTMQAFAMMMNNFKNHPYRSLFYQISMPILASGIIVPFINMVVASWRDDDDDDDVREQYGNLPEWERRNNICLYKGKGEWITIPLPLELRGFYAIGEILASEVLGDTAWGQSMGWNKMDSDRPVGYQVADIFLAYTPLSIVYTGGGFESEEDWRMVAPQLVKPFLEVSYNKSWTGAPIWNDADYLQYYPEWQKAYSNTNPYIVEFCRWLNKATGGDDVQPSKAFWGWGNLNPAKIDHLLKGYASGPYKFVNKLATVYKLAKAGDKDAISADKFPITEAFWYNYDEAQQAKRYNALYYKYKEEAEETKAWIRGYEDRGDIDGLLKLMAEPRYKRREIINDYETERQKFSAGIRKSHAREDEDTEEVFKRIRMLSDKAIVEELDKIK